MSNCAITWARGVTGLDPAEKLVLLLLADQANSRFQAWPSVARLSADGCVGERTVQRALSSLARRGLVVREGAGGRSLTRLYTLAVVLAERVTQEAERVPDRHPLAPPERVTPEAERVTPEVKRVTSAAEKGVNVAPEPSREPIEPKKEKKARASVPAVVADLPAWLPPDAWAEWCRHRIGMKKAGWTDGAAVRCIADLAKFRDAGDDPRAVIDQSIAGGWTGLFPLKRHARRDNGEIPNKIAWMAEFIGGGSASQPQQPAYDLDLTAEEIP